MSTAAIAKIDITTPHTRSGSAKIANGKSRSCFDCVVETDGPGMPVVGSSADNESLPSNTNSKPLAESIF